VIKVLYDIYSNTIAYISLSTQKDNPRTLHTAIATKKRIIGVAQHFYV